MIEHLFFYSFLRIFSLVFLISLPILVVQTSFIKTPRYEQILYMLILSICIASSLQNFLISLFFMGVLALFLIVGSNSVFLKGYMYVKQVNMALVINMFATLALMESTTLFHFFLLLEVFLALSMFFLSSEHNLSHHSFLYLIPNVVVGIIFLAGIVVTVMSMGTMHLASLSLMSQSVPSFLLIGFVVSSLSFSLVILCKMFSFPFNLFLPQIYNNLTAPSLAFFS